MHPRSLFILGDIHLSGTDRVLLMTLVLLSTPFGAMRNSRSLAREISASAEASLDDNDAFDDLGNGDSIGPMFFSFLLITNVGFLVLGGVKLK